MTYFDQQTDLINTIMADNMHIVKTQHLSKLKR
jgi:hypothetical protein